MEPSVIFFSILFSCIGIGYYKYGKKGNGYFQLAGIILLIFTFFISNLWWLIIFGTLITLLPFLLERFW